MKRFGIGTGFLIVMLVLFTASLVFAAARELTHKSIEELETLGTSPAVDDFFLIMDTSAGKVKKSLPAVAVTGDVSFNSITMDADKDITMGTGTIQFDSVKSDFVFTDDIDIEQATPHIGFRDTDDDVAYQFHLDSSPITGAPWQNFALWRGTDDGTGFSVATQRPIFYCNPIDSIVFPATRVQLKQDNSDIASANSMVLGEHGNTFFITGNTQINLISRSNWQKGSVIHLVFASNPSVKHSQSTSGNNTRMLLSGAGDFSASSNDTLTLVLVETSLEIFSWMEIARTVI